MIFGELAGIAWEVGEEEGEVGFEDFAWEMDFEGAFFAARGDQAFIEGFADDFPAGCSFQAYDLWDCTPVYFPLDDKFAEEFGEVVPHLWVDVEADEAEMAFNAFLQFEGLDQVQHEGDLVEDLGQEENAEAGESFVAEVAPSIVVVVARLVGFLQVLVVGGPGSGESA